MNHRMLRLATRAILACLLVGFPSHSLFGQAVELPPRPATALKGAEFARTLTDKTLSEREDLILAEFKTGNIPSFLRTFVPITVTKANVKLTYFVTPDYLAVGSDDDYFLTPLTPHTAQKLADSLNCILPTTRMVDDIYAAATVRLTPSPIPPTPAMTTIPVFLRHNEIVGEQRKALPPGGLVAGHKKDVVIANKVFSLTGKVGIYGWHQTPDKPIQPLYTGHTSLWVDYSHGIRLVHRRLLINGEPRQVDDVLADPQLAALISDEGVMKQTRYDLTRPPTPGVKTGPRPAPGEAIDILSLDRGVRIVINRPDTDPLPAKPILLVFYALPNGNTIEQTLGKTPQAGDDWHFDIQHIAAQTRFLRETITDRTIVIAYLENDLKSWPAWRKKNGDEAIAPILETVMKRFDAARTRIVLSGHSGGGSLIFGYLNTVESIPDRVERIAFLDANYAYETDRHRDKLANWLKAADSHFLCILAYNDAVALLNGKTFVSESGGTWGRSLLMRQDLGGLFSFTDVLTADYRRHSALQGRLEFFMTENPDKKILHTVQVEKNGFIECLLSGTKFEGSGYTYMGDRAYSRFIRPD